MPSQSSTQEQATSAVAKFVAAIVELMPSAKPYPYLREEEPMLTQIEKTVAGKIATQPQAEAVNQALRTVVQVRKKRQAWFDVIKKPVNALRGVILSHERTALEPVESLENTMRNRLKIWVREAEEAARQKRAEEVRRREEEERQRLAAEAEALRRVAETFDDPMEAIGLMDQADAIAAAEPTVAIPPIESTSLPGLSVPRKWGFEVTDFNLVVESVCCGQLPIDALRINPDWVMERITAMDGNIKIPGIKVVDRSYTVVR